MHHAIDLVGYFINKDLLSGTTFFMISSLIIANRILLAINLESFYIIESEFNIAYFLNKH